MVGSTKMFILLSDASRAMRDRCVCHADTVWYPILASSGGWSS